MTQFRVCAAVALAGMVAAAPVAAQGKSGAVHGSPTTTATSHGRPTTGPGSSTTTHGQSGTTTRGQSGTDRGRSATDHGRPSSTTSTTETTTTTTTTTTTAAPTAISTKISRNPNQLARITAMLPAGMTLEEATAGFRNQGQFIAALNASKNQGVSFTDLQKAMTVDGLSLGQAVKTLRGTTETEGGTPATTTPTTGGTTTTTTPTTSAS